MQRVTRSSDQCLSFTGGAADVSKQKMKHWQRRRCFQASAQKMKPNERNYCQAELLVARPSRCDGLTMKLDQPRRVCSTLLDIALAPTALQRLKSNIVSCAKGVGNHFRQGGAIR